MSDTAAELSPKDRIKAAMDKHSLTITSEFVPFSKSRNAKPQENGKVWRSLNWTVTLVRKMPSKGRMEGYYATILTTDYSAGEAHCPSYKAPVAQLGNRDSVMRHEAIAKEIETGRRAFRNPEFGTFGAAGPVIKPDAVDVLHSLVSDSDVLDCSTFEEWADNLGYDKDSRKAEATYRECLALALKLRNGLGEAALAELREAAQDY